MSSGDDVFRRIQSVARSTAAKSGTSAPTQEYLIRHTLESFLDRLTRTSHVGDFVLKGGILLAAYGVRRPTKDTDSNAISTNVTAERLAQVVRDIAAIDVDDGVVFDLDTISVQEIREQAAYPALRVRVAVSIGPWKGVAAWDVSTGDPIVPPPRQVTIDRILSDPIALLGYAPETTIAEKGSPFSNAASQARAGVTTSTSSRSHGAASTPTSFSAKPGQSLSTAESLSNRSHRTSPATAQSHKRNGPHGAARNTSSLPASKTSTTRSPSSLPTSIRSSSRAPNSGFGFDGSRQ
ncbi:MAG: hypothetical protein QOI28_2548 [Mycobacterium sp.]|nr:hypothetical protein [Mycobacterium sp.]MDT5264291.1 hypothetical protein [Mycobacterium sp.]MDT5361992.1 hypothetical protein [Mycobacterium sp.]